MNYKFVHMSVVLADAATVSVILPSGSRGHLFRVAEAIAWKVSHTATGVPTGFPLGSGEGMSIEESCVKQEVFFRQVSGAPATLHWVYQTPTIG